MSDFQRVGVIEVDFEQSRRGLRSCLAEDLSGKCILARTIERTLEARTIGRLILVVHQSQESEARSLVGELPVEWFVHSHQDLEDRRRLRRARRWGKEGWSGGIAGTYFACEAGNPRALAELCEAGEIDRVALIPAEAAFVDPALIDEIVEADREKPENRVYLSTTSPGLAPDVFHVETFQEMCRREASLDSLMARDFTSEGTVWEQKNLFHPFREEVSRFRGRFTVDSVVSLDLFRRLLEGAEPENAREMADLWLSNPDVVAGPGPEELIVELHGSGPINDDVWACVLESLSLRDDALLTLVGGSRDAAEDPRLAERVAQARSHGAHGIHVQTSGDAVAADLIRGDLDVVTVDLGRGDRESSHVGLKRLVDARGEAREPFIAIAHELSEANMHTWEQIWDRWWDSTDAMSVWSPEGRRGEEVSGSLGLFTPPQRFACMRLVSQMRVMANGEIPLCARDPEVEEPMGTLPLQTVGEVWQGDPFRRARKLHREEQWGQVAHCGQCHSWCRFD